jgi:hypothetical protein
MSNTINPKLPRIVKVILDIIFWLLVGVTTFLVFWIVFAPVILNVSDIVITSSVPVAIGSGDEPRFEVEVAGADARGIRNAFIDEAQGTLRLETTDWYLIFVSNLGKLVTAFGLLYVVYLLRSLFNAILRDEIFTHENAILVRRIGFAVLIAGFLKAAAEYFAAQAVLRQLTITNPPLSLPSPFEAVILLTSLLILVLAQVWSYGLELEREKALTI